MSDLRSAWLSSKIRPGEVLFQLQCGDGSLANWFSKNGWHITGSESRSDLLVYARSYATQHGLGSLFYDEAVLPNHAFGKYDVVIYVAHDGLSLSLISLAFKI